MPTWFKVTVNTPRQLGATGIVVEFETLNVINTLRVDTTAGSIKKHGGLMNVVKKEFLEAVLRDADKAFDKAIETQDHSPYSRQQ